MVAILLAFFEIADQQEMWYSEFKGYERKWVKMKNETKKAETEALEQEKKEKAELLKELRKLRIENEILKERMIQIKELVSL